MSRLLDLSSDQKSEDERLKRNLWLLQLFKALVVADLVFAVVVPFHQQNGLSNSEIFVVVSGMFTSSLISEIPSGRFADRYGRKYSMVLGAILLGISYTTLALSYGFWTTLMSGSILGLGFSFIGGADSALAYDSVKRLGQEDSYYRQKDVFTRFESVGFTYRAIGGGSAALVGAWLASYSNIRLVIWIQLPVYVLLLCTALLLREVSPVETVKRRSPINIRRLIRYVLHDHKELKWLLLYMAVLVASWDIAGWLRPSYYQLLNVPPDWFGALQAASLVGMALTARLAMRYERLGRKKVLWSLIVATIVGFALPAMTPSGWLLPFLMSMLLLYSAGYPVLSNYANSLIDSEVRASSLSIISLVTRLCFAITSPIIGWLTDRYSLSTALWFSMALFGGLGVVALVVMTKVTSPYKDRVN